MKNLLGNITAKISISKKRLLNVSGRKLNFLIKNALSEQKKLPPGSVLQKKLFGYNPF
ncbi:MAG: hypothetical protein R2747_07930 [Pyrinomonadaceae bacterium]